MPKIVSVKCPNCGANLELDDNKKRAKCQYCNTSLLIEKDFNDIFSAQIINTSKIAKGILYYIFLSFIVSFIFTIVITISIFAFSSKSSSSFNKSKFNSSFTYANGTQSGLFVADTLDKVITSNKTNDKQIYVKYDDVKTNKEDEIISIKTKLETLTYYEVSIDYDKDGYVNIVTIRDKK